MTVSCWDSVADGGVNVKVGFGVADVQIILKGSRNLFFFLLFRHSIGNLESRSSTTDTIPPIAAAGRIGHTLTRRDPTRLSRAGAAKVLPDAGSLFPYPSLTASHSGSRTFLQQ